MRHRLQPSMAGRNQQPFPDLKGQAPLRQDRARSSRTRDGVPFPDLKGQAPLRPAHPAAGSGFPGPLFLTSKVRLHCDKPSLPWSTTTLRSLFLTSKVRLHCDYLDPPYLPATRRLFPDLKGQAPLRLGLALRAVMQFGDFFLTSKVRLHCDVVTGGTPRSGWSGLFLTSKVRLHCDGIPGSLTLGIELFLTSKVRLHCDRSYQGEPVDLDHFS